MHPCDQGVRVGASELPFEWMRDAFAVALRVLQPFGHRIRAGEVVGGERLALHDWEVYLDPVEPARMNWAVGAIQTDVA